MSSPSPTLLGIPRELRDEIFEHVLEHDLELEPYENTSLDYYGSGLIVPVPNVINICQQIREEGLDIVFRKRTVFFWTFGELGAAMLSQPRMVQFWRSVRVKWTGRRFLGGDGDRWRVEPGLQLLSHIPTLRHLHLETEMIRCIGDTSTEVEIAVVMNQIITKPEIVDHPTLNTLKITGTMSEHRPARLSGPTFDTPIIFMDFCRVYTRRRDGSWELKDCSENPWFDHA